MKISRRVRRFTRSVERTVRRVVREVDTVNREILGAVPVVGDVLAPMGLAVTPQMKAQSQAVKREKEQQARLDKMASDQRAEEQWAKEQQQAQAQIGQTQLDARVGGTGQGSTVGLEEEDPNTVDASEDKLKKLLKKKI